MTTILFDSTVSSKPAAWTFGRGIPSERRMPYTQADLDWAAQFFGGLEDNRELEDQALQAEWDDRFNGTIPAGYCRSCGELAETDRDGLCDRCEREGTEATIASANRRAGLGYRVF